MVIDMTEKEKLMYSFISQISKTNAPIIFKGGLITNLILSEKGYTDIQRTTKDIDANWINTPPSTTELVEQINDTLGDLQNQYLARISREYGENRSAGITFIEKSTGDKLFSMDIDMKPFLGSKNYFYGEMSIRGVLANEIIADKICVLSSDDIYKRRTKDIIDIYSLSHCTEINVKDIFEVCKKVNRKIKSFDGFYNYRSEVEHAYNKLKGIVGKPPFDNVYDYLSKFVPPFADRQITDIIWNPQKTIWQQPSSIKEPYYIKVTYSEAEQLKERGIEFVGKLSDTDQSVIQIQKSYKDQAIEILNQLRKTNGLRI